MIQLRDSLTSELLYEGSPAEVAAIAREIGFDKILFDGVGENFDPLAVLEAHDEAKKNLDAAAGTSDDEVHEEAMSAALQALLDIDGQITGAIPKVKRAMKDARDLHEPGHEDDATPDIVYADEPPPEVEPVKSEFTIGEDGTPKKVE